uniref:ATP-dependent zinc metalloprotease FtsH n=2 Tax=Thermosporothrix TaxID=768650 RepID=A0A455SP18_9CHLR|nr:ATP-dependent zinc metalloprotease FtsH [Thermosporothrix sp. COM3]
MDNKPDNNLWLQNSNDRQPMRPGPSGRPNGQNSNPPPSNRFNTWLLVLVLAMLALFLFNYFNTLGRNANSPRFEMDYSEFLQQVEQKNVESVTFQGDSEITGTFRNSYKNHKEFKTYQLPIRDPQLPDLLRKNNVTTFTYEPPPDNSLLINLLITVVPLIFLIGVSIYLSRRVSQGQQGIFNFGKSRAKLILEDRPSTTFADIAGVDEAKYELQEVVEFLKTPQKFQRLGGKIPRGVLLVGPPGTGKTLLARAVAGEAGVPFFSMSGSEFVEVLVGVGASRVRDLFDQAKKASPSIIFIDEIDAVGRQRGSSINTNDEREQTLNQLLVEMDGFDSRQAVVVLAATNRPEGLDQALLRPGRFDRRVTVDRPDWNGRMSILKIHTRNVPLASDVDLQAIARSTTGMVGADLANLVNEAALLAARRNQDLVTQRCFEDALDKILLGAERPLVLSDEDLQVTAYHEGGHALAALVTEGADPITKVTIVPRGQALGVTMATPFDDRYNYPKEYLLAQIVYALGGRAAEQAVFHRITTGAENDLQRVTMIARQMVTRWGMSERLGTVSFSERQSPFMGGDVGNPTDYSEETAQIIDEEISRIVSECYERTYQIMQQYRPTLDRIAEELRKQETIDAKVLHAICEETGAPLASTQKRPRVPQIATTVAPPPPPERPQPPEMEHQQTE